MPYPPWGKKGGADEKSEVKIAVVKKMKPSSHSKRKWSEFEGAKISGVISNEGCGQQRDDVFGPDGNPVRRGKNGSRGVGVLPEIHIRIKKQKTQPPTE